MSESSAAAGIRLARAGRQAAAVLALAAAAFVLMHVVLSAPSQVLLRVAHRLPGWADARSALYVSHVVLVIAVFCALRVPTRVWAGGAVVPGGLQAVLRLTAGSALLSALVAFSLLSSSSSADGERPFTTLVAQLTSAFPVTGLAGRFAADGVLGPFSEELLFRALLLGFLFSRTPRWLGLGVTSALFASVHSGPLFAGAAGVAYGLVYLRYQSIWICTIAHALNNLVSAGVVTLLFAYLREENYFGPGQDGLRWLQLLFLCLSVACYFMFFKLVLRDLAVGMWLTGRPADERPRPDPV